MLRRIAALGAAAAVACLSAGVAQAETSHAGSVPNGGCDAQQQLVQVSGPSRIDAEVSSTSAVTTTYANILGSNGAVLASGSTASYDTPGGGEYFVQICSWYSQIDPPSLQYSALSATGPAGRPALHATGVVFSANTALSPALDSGTWFVAR